jgi:hypothetical protein
MTLSSLIYCSEPRINGVSQVEDIMNAAVAANAKRSVTGCRNLRRRPRPEARSGQVSPAGLEARPQNSASRHDQVCAAEMMSAPFSATIRDGALVLAEVMLEKTDASTTRNASTP